MASARTTPHGPREGETVTASATGDLTIHGVTNEVTFEVEAKLVGDTMLKEWLAKAGPEGQAVVDAFRK